MVRTNTGTYLSLNCLVAHCKEQVMHTDENVIALLNVHINTLTIGPNFKYASNFLWPFKLNTPTGGWRKKVTHFVEGGDFGCHKDKTNELFKKMI